MQKFMVSLLLSAAIMPMLLDQACGHIVCDKDDDCDFDQYCSSDWGECRDSVVCVSADECDHDQYCDRDTNTCDDEVCDADDDCKPDQYCDNRLSVCLNRG
ncbi:uncharacterized protein LOC120339969 isoform X2 [Styela clava]